MRPFHIIALVVLCVVVTLPTSARRAASCQPPTPMTRLAGVPEASGIAVGRRNPAVLWAINDSGLPAIVALDAQGRVVGRVRVTGAQLEDWEDVSVGPCPGGSCVYIADIGDNNARRPRVTIYRVAEPDPYAAASDRAEAMHLTYPDGPQDAEAMFVGADGQLVVITKGETGPIAVYRTPAFRAGATGVKLERLAALSLGGASGGGGRVRVTDAEASADGQWIALRTHDAVVFYRPASLISRSPRESLRGDVRSLKEPQGEGVALGSGGSVFLVGEGTATAGTFARMRCTLDGLD